MNLVEALGEALPELPAQAGVKTYPRMDPRVIAREHIEQGAPTVLAKMPGADNFVRLSPEQWRLLQLFDGQRDYAEISEVFLAETGVPFVEEDVREFATFMGQETDLFYKTPLEKNITLKQKSHSHREKRKRFRIGDVTDITLHRWPRADDYLTRLHPHVKFFYTWWCTALTLVAFGVMAWMWVDKFHEIWADSFEFYNFTAKGFTDLVEFWLLFGAMAFFHESAHGMSCKHFGGAVEKMEFILMYFAPTFVCDVTQIWIYGDRFARLVTIISGIWFDLIICVFATTIWWATATGMAIHDFAYKVMMVSGIGVTLLNLNPLIKLDGYYMFSEIIGEVDLKERATGYLSSWMRKRIFRLPVEIEYVPRRRRAFYIVYAILSGLYSYLLMVVVVVFLHHVLRSLSPDWAFVPSAGIAYLVFKSRLRTLVRFMKTLYLDKKERLSAWLTPSRLAGLGAAALLLLVAPLWPDFVEGKFVLEAAQRAVIRAEVPGSVQEVLAEEAQHVEAGAVVARLRNLPLESEAARAASELRVASARATQAQLQYAAFGPADRERQQLAERSRALAEQVSRLQLTSPISGVILTPHVRDLAGSYVPAGTLIAEVADLSHMLARVYVPEFSMRDVRLGAPATLQPRAFFRRLSGRLVSLAPVSAPIAAGLVESDQLKGIRPPQFYVATVRLDDSRELKEGMSGTAKIFVRRRSLVEFGWRFMRDLVQRRFW